MRTYRIVYLDGTFEDIKGYSLGVWDGVLTIEQNYPSAYDRAPRSWPLTSIRSWEDVSG